MIPRREIDFDGLNTSLLAQYPDVLFRWFPGGKLVKNEFCIGNLAGDAGDSCKINIRSGKWSDFATGDKGGDPIGLYAAAFHGGDRVTAAKALGGENIVSIRAGRPDAPRRQPEPEFVAIVPPPANAPEPDLNAPVSGCKPSAVYTYRSQDGAVLFYVRRIDPPGKKKSFSPLTYGTLDGVTRWHAKHPPAPRPLYNLPSLTSPRVRVICEGEKATDAARKLLPHNPCLCWSAGAQNFRHSDLSPLAGSKVILWPDADDEGRKAMQEVAALLHAMGCEVHIVDTTDLPRKFDAADLPPDTDGMAWLKPRLRAYVPSVQPSPSEEPPPAPPPAEDPYSGSSPEIIPPSYSQAELLPSYRELEDRVTGMSETTQPRVIEEFALDVARARLSPVETERLTRLLKERTKTNVTTVRRIIDGVQRSEARDAAITKRKELSLTKRYIFVKQVNMFWDRNGAALASLEAVRNHHWSEMPTDQDGMRISPLVPLLQDQDGCDKADVITFHPGADEIIEEDGVLKLNVWKPSNCPRKAGDASPFERHIVMLCDGNEIATAHVLDYLAHLVQRPGVKIRSSLLIIGGHGIGKSLVGDTMTLILGPKNVAAVEESQLRSSFNEWMDGTQLVIVNELQSMDRKETMNRLKSYIADRYVTINRKNTPTYSYLNRTNFIMFSNHRDAASIERGDRRYFIWESSMPPQPQAYYDEFHDWRDNLDGLAIIHDYLATRDISDFNPSAHAPMTAVKAEIQRLSVSGVQVYIEEAIEAGDAPFGSDIINLNRAQDYLTKDKRLQITLHKLGDALRNLGCVDLGQMRIEGTRRRLWAIRNVDRWSSSQVADIEGYLRRLGYFGSLQGGSESETARFDDM